MKRRWFSPLLLLLALGGPAASKSDSAANPQVAPSFTLPALHGTASLDSLRGKVVLVDFWASWCAPCRKSFAWLNGLQDRYKDHGLAVVAINLDKKRDPADDFLYENPARFTVAFDPAGKTAEAFHVSAMPSTYLIGRNGTILGFHTGFDPNKTDQLDQLIKETCLP